VSVLVFEVRYEQDIAHEANFETTTLKAAANPILSHAKIDRRGAPA
jgi:hypothetical protein